MEYRRLGHTGLRVSVLALGTNALGGRADREASRAIVERALELGINLIDTANTYTGGASETILGEVLEHRRAEVLLATKAGMPAGPGPNDAGSSRHHLLRELEGSLHRLRTDYIDLYWIHRFDPETPLEETLRALDDMVRAGKVRYVGASNYAAWQVCKALWVSDRRHFVRFSAVQPSYSLADRRVERELIPLCLDQGLGLLAYYPLAGGILTGKYRAGAAPPPGSRAVSTPQFARRLTPEGMRLAADVAALAREAGVAPAQLAIAWLLGRPGVTSAIVGATSVAQLEENAAALEVRGRLEPELERRLDELSAGCVDVPVF